MNSFILQKFKMNFFSHIRVTSLALVDVGKTGGM